MKTLFIIMGHMQSILEFRQNILKINTLKIPDSLTYKEAALTEPLACVVHGADVSNITEGDTVAVNGAGPIGLLGSTCQIKRYQSDIY